MKCSSSRIRTSDLRMTSCTLQSSALPTELSKKSRVAVSKFKTKIVHHTDRLLVFLILVLLTYSHIRQESYLEKQ